MSIKSCEKVANFWECKMCDYVTSRKSSYDKHILSTKHNLSIMSMKKLQKVAQQNECLICHKIYTDQSGLWRHNKKYHSQQLNTEESPSPSQSQQLNAEETKRLTDLIMKVVEQNQELTKQIIELSKTPTQGIINNNVSGNTVNNNSNNKFNLNFYLNETCKNAMNMSDFVSSLVVSVKDLEETSRLGYSEGISKIFLDGLKNIGEHDRPVHCADQKREILYIKNNNEWIKDTEDKAELTKAIKTIANKNIKQIIEWQKLHPDYNNPKSKQSDKYQKIILNSMSGSTKEESDKNYGKIIKNIAKETVIDKQRR